MALSAEDWDDLAEMLGIGGAKAHQLAEEESPSSVLKRGMRMHSEVLFTMAAQARRVRNRRADR